MFYKKLSKFKHFEMECVSDNYHLFSFEFKIGFKEDHAGVRAALSFLGKEIYLHLYDVRHWDRSNNCWCNSVNIER